MALCDMSKLDAETAKLIQLALRLGAEAESVCEWFTPDFEGIAALNAAANAFGDAYGPWYERHYSYDVDLHDQDCDYP
jgi:hypothetical protein